MSAAKSSNGQVAAENELLAQLGLPPSATTEDVDQLHLAVSQFLATSPSSIKGWARAQAAALDAAYLTLIDPVGLGGSALRSPTRPPTVVPGGPATPPARRGPVAKHPSPIAAATEADDDAGASGPRDLDDTDTDDLDTLFASVTPGAHRDLTTGGKPAKAGSRFSKRGIENGPAAAVAQANPASTGSNRWKAAALALAGIIGALAILFVGYNLGGGGSQLAANVAPSASVQTVDMAQISQLMAKLQANPKDTATMQAIGDTYFSGGDYTDAGTFYDQVLGIDAKNEKALLARGAVYFNSGDATKAEQLWKQVISIDAKSQEAHYDLGFLYMSQTTPDWAKVQSEWTTAIAINPTSQLAQTVQQHLDSLVKASMIPAPSGSLGASGAPSASGSPAASGAAASPSGTVATSAQPSAQASPAPSTSGSAAP